MYFLLHVHTRVDMYLIKEDIHTHTFICIYICMYMYVFMCMDVHPSWLET